MSALWWLLAISLVLLAVEWVSAAAVRRRGDPLRADWSRRTIGHLGTLITGSVGAITAAAFLLYPPAWAVLLVGGAGGVLAVSILWCAFWRWLNAVFATPAHTPARSPRPTQGHPR